MSKCVVRIPARYFENSPGGEGLEIPIQRDDNIEKVTQTALKMARRIPGMIPESRFPTKFGLFTKDGHPLSASAPVLTQINGDLVLRESGGDPSNTCPSCGCAKVGDEKFCLDCGIKFPAFMPVSASAPPSSVYTCACGTQNDSADGAFCIECGAKTPEPKSTLVSNTAARSMMLSTRGGKSATLPSALVRANTGLVDQENKPRPAVPTTRPPSLPPLSVSPGISRELSSGNTHHQRSNSNMHITTNVSAKSPVGIPSASCVSSSSVAASSSTSSSSTSSASSNSTNAFAKTVSPSSASSACAAAASKTLTSASSSPSSTSGSGGGGARLQLHPLLRDTSKNNVNAAPSPSRQAPTRTAPVKVTPLAYEIVEFEEVGGKTISLEELSSHNQESDAWVGLYGKVYNVTGWLAKHPGGARVLLRVCGKDATEMFIKFHTQEVLDEHAQSFYVGQLDPDEVSELPTIKKKPKPANLARKLSQAMLAQRAEEELNQPSVSAQMAATTASANANKASSNSGAANKPFNNSVSSPSASANNNNNNNNNNNQVSSKPLTNAASATVPASIGKPIVLTKDLSAGYVSSPGTYSSNSSSTPTSKLNPQPILSLSKNGSDSKVASSSGGDTRSSVKREEQPLSPKTIIHPTHTPQPALTTYNAASPTSAARQDYSIKKKEEAVPALAPRPAPKVFVEATFVDATPKQQAVQQQQQIAKKEEAPPALAPRPAPKVAAAAAAAAAAFVAEPEVKRPPPPSSFPPETAINRPPPPSSFPTEAIVNRPPPPSSIPRQVVENEPPVNRPPPPSSLPREAVHVDTRGSPPAAQYRQQEQPSPFEALARLDSNRPPPPSSLPRIEKPTHAKTQSFGRPFEKSAETIRNLVSILASDEGLVYVATICDAPFRATLHPQSVDALNILLGDGQQVEFREIPGHLKDQLPNLLKKYTAESSYRFGQDSASDRNMAKICYAIIATGKNYRTFGAMSIAFPAVHDVEAEYNRLVREING